MNPMMQPPVGMMNRQPTQNNPSMRMPPQGMPPQGMPPQGIPGQWSPPTPPPYIKLSIQKGDTLSGLAKRHRTSVSSLMYLNGIKSADMIYAGNEILVPNPQFPKNGMTPAPQGTPQQPAMAPRNTPHQMSAMPPGRPMGMPQLGMGPRPPITLNEDMMNEVGAAAVPFAGGLAAAMPSLIKRLAGGAPAALPKAGRIAENMAKGAVDHPGAARTMSNVRPIGGQPTGDGINGVARAMLNSKGGPGYPYATTIKPNPDRMDPSGLVRALERDSKANALPMDPIMGTAIKGNPSRIDQTGTRLDQLLASDDVAAFDEAYSREMAGRAHKLHKSSKK